MNRFNKTNKILSILFIFTLFNNLGYSENEERGAGEILFDKYTCSQLKSMALSKPATLFKDWADPIILGESQSMLDGIAKRGNMLEFLSNLGEVVNIIQILEATASGSFREVTKICLDQAFGKALEALGKAFSTGVPGAVWTAFKSLNDIAVYLNNDILRLNINTFAILADSDLEILGDEGVDIFLLRYCRIDMERGWDSRRTLTTRIAVQEYAQNRLNINNFPAFGDWTKAENINWVRSVVKSLLKDVNDARTKMKERQKVAQNALNGFKKEVSILTQFSSVLDRVSTMLCIECDNNEKWYFSTMSCECIEGYAFNQDADCIKVQDCDENEYWDEYEGACECNKGYSEDEDGECVPIQECDETTEYWDADEGDCECNFGYSENKHGDCVEIQECDETTEYWDAYEGACECEDGYTEDKDGDCIKVEDCGDNEYWDEDEGACECIDGYEEDEKGNCIEKEEEEEEEKEDVDDCSIGYINSLVSLLEFLVADTKLSETELISYINKFNKEINDQSSDPCDNSIIAYCYYSASEIAARMAENVSDIHDLTVEIIMTQAICPDLSQQMQGEGITIKSLVSSISGLGSYKDKLAQMESRLRENGCDEDEVKEDGEKIVPPEGDPGFIQDGGISTEMPGDGVDNDGDGQQDEEVQGLSGYNVTLVLYDSGSVADDVFNLYVEGYGNLGRTPAGGLRSYGLNLLPGTYTAVVSVVLAPDDVGTYTLTVLYNGESVGSITGSPPQGSSATLSFTVPSE